MISGICCGVNEIFTLLGHCTTVFTLGDETDKYSQNVSYISTL
jgi:hypothetical protein